MTRMLGLERYLLSRQQLYILSSYLAPGVRGLLTIVLLSSMGAETAGIVATMIAPLHFVSMLVTAYSAEYYIRGLHDDAQNIKTRLAVIYDSAFLLLSFLFIVLTPTTFLALPAIAQYIPLSYCFAQISLNLMIHKQAWVHIAGANLFDASCNVFLYLYGLDPLSHFLFLGISRWIALNIFLIAYLLSERPTRLTIGNMPLPSLDILKNLYKGIEIPHVINLGFKNAWSILDVYLVGVFWGATGAGEYRLVKAAGGIPAMLVAPRWTIVRHQLNTYLQDQSQTGRAVNLIFLQGIQNTVPLVVILICLQLFFASDLGLDGFEFEDPLYPLIGFALWWLLPAWFGWVRYVVVSFSMFSTANLQNICILVALLCVCGGALMGMALSPIFMFPLIIILSNSLIIEKLRRTL